MLECWNEDPKSRPSFSNLKERFEGLMSESDGYLDFDEINEDSIYYKVPSFNSQGDDEIDVAESQNIDDNDDQLQTIEFDV